MSYTGGKLISDVLTASGIRTVFAVGGASFTHLLNPLNEAGVTIVSSRHEAGAVGAADGYARIRAAPGVALIVADQGLPNAVGALAVAWHAGSPTVVLVASPPRTHVEADRVIDQDQLALVSPICKWARSVPSVDRLDDYLQSALKHATGGRPGPVVLLVPEEQLQAEVLKRAVEPLPAAALPQPQADAIDEAAALISQAQRPMIISGGGAAWSNASDVLAGISDRWSIPVLGNSLGRGQVAEDNKLSFSWPYAQIAAKDADVVVVVGARLTQRLGLGLPPRFAADAKFIQIDIDAGAFHRNRPVDIAIQADARAALTMLADALDAKGTTPFDPAWLHDGVQNRSRRVRELIDAKSRAVHPLQLGNAIMQRLSANAQLVGDGADIQTWMYGAVRVRRPRGFLDHYPMGAMGSATALAVGAAAAHKEQDGEGAPLTVLVTGDGAFGFHPAEIHAAVRANLNLLVIVGNDGAWGTEMHGQLEVIGRAINTELDVLPYEKLGEAFGASGSRIASPADLDAGLDAAFAGRGVRVVNVEIDRTAGRELKQNPDVRMIMFSDILDGQADLQ
ncbi:MAG: thiamine pyrophosphate-binding protein [Woeseiaceae bacterium]